MAREAEKEIVEQLLRRVGFGAGTPPSPADCAAQLITRAEVQHCVGEVYRALGGRLAILPLRPLGWDITTAAFVVEFDEEQHFNRYRLRTLDCPLYNQLPSFPRELYRDFCRSNETECARKACGGQYWTSRSTENQFGASDAPGIFAPNGPARWKQRAFYDLLRDLAPLANSITISRISIWDKVCCDNECISLRRALVLKRAEAASAIIDLILERAGHKNQSLSANNC